VGLEYIRGYMIDGFSWYLLAHCQYRFTTLIQISDLCGGYLLSGLMVLCSSALAMTLPAKVWQSLRLLPRPSGNTAVESAIMTEPVRHTRIAVISGCALFAAALIYGGLRL
jgi:apolipoprotein N-acyltransferase